MPGKAQKLPLVDGLGCNTSGPLASTRLDIHMHKEVTLNLGLFKGWQQHIPPHLTPPHPHTSPLSLGS